MVCDVIYSFIFYWIRHISLWQSHLETSSLHTLTIILQIDGCFSGLFKRDCAIIYHNTFYCTVASDGTFKPLLDDWYLGMWCFRRTPAPKGKERTEDPRNCKTQSVIVYTVHQRSRENVLCAMTRLTPGKSGVLNPDCLWDLQSVLLGRYHG